MTPQSKRVELLQGTLDMLVLRTLRLGPLHGQAIARSIEQNSDDVLRIDHGSLYPALQRLLQEGWITAEWGTSASNRKARFYTLTEAGKKQLRQETSKWDRAVRAIAQVLSPARQE